MSGIQAKNAEVGAVYRTSGEKLVTVIAKNYLERVLIHVHATGTEVPVPGDYILMPAPDAEKIDVGTLTRLYGAEISTEAEKPKKSRRRTAEKSKPTVSKPPQESQDEVSSSATKARARQSATQSGSSQSQNQVLDRSVLIEEVLGLLRTGCRTHREVYHSLVARWPHQERRVLEGRSKIVLDSLCRERQISKRTVGKDIHYEVFPESA